MKLIHLTSPKQNDKALPRSQLYELGTACPCVNVGSPTSPDNKHEFMGKPIKLEYHMFRKHPKSLVFYLQGDPSDPFGAFDLRDRNQYIVWLKSSLLVAKTQVLPKVLAPHNLLISSAETSKQADEF